MLDIKATDLFTNRVFFFFYFISTKFFYNKKKKKKKKNSSNFSPKFLKVYRKLMQEIEYDDIIDVVGSSTKLFASGWV